MKIELIPTVNRKLKIFAFTLNNKHKNASICVKKIVQNIVIENITSWK